jgi:hypothetical protein
MYLARMSGFLVVSGGLVGHDLFFRRSKPSIPKIGTSDGPPLPAAIFLEDLHGGSKHRVNPCWRALYHAAAPFLDAFTT